MPPLPSLTKSGPDITALPPPDDSVDDEKALLVLDDEGIVEKATEFARRLLDLGPQSLTGRSFFRRVHPDDRPRILWKLSEIASQGAQHAPSLLRLKTGLGPWRWFKLAARLPQSDEDGQIVLRLFERGRRSPR